jgi:hypothetical protein
MADDNPSRYERINLLLQVLSIVMLGAILYLQLHSVELKSRFQVIRPGVALDTVTGKPCITAPEDLPSPRPGVPRCSDLVHP